jgi:phosphoglycolate phosphatase
MTYLAFDIDGTIYDCGDIIVDAFHEGIGQFMREFPNYHIAVPEKDSILSLVGTPTDLIFKRLFPGLKDSDYGLIEDRCTVSLSRLVRKGGGRIFEGVYETIKKLYDDKYTLLVASNGRRAYIEAILSTYRLAKFFKEPLIIVNDKTIKNKTDIIKYYKDNISRIETLIMIGDRSSDRIAAIENSIPFIGCAFGHAGDSEIDSPWIAESFTDIPDLVKKIESLNTPDGN